MTEVDRVREAARDAALRAARKTADVMLSSWGYVDTYPEAVENLASDALQAALDAEVVVLADDVAERVREAQERALREAADNDDFRATCDHLPFVRLGDMCQCGWLRAVGESYAASPRSTDAADTQPEKETP